MSDPTGTVGLPASSGPQSDMAAVYEGGRSFMDRMAALGRLRDEQEAAFAKLNIGNDAKAAYDDARAKQAEAEAMRAKAAQTLADAERKAAATLADAKEKSDRIIADAQARAAQADAESSEKVKQADAYESGAKERAAALTAKTEAANKQAADLFANNAREADRLAEAQRVTEETRQQAAAVRDELKSKIDQIKTAITQIAG